MDIPKPTGPENLVFQGKMIEVVEQSMQAGDKSFTLEFARRSPGTRLIVPMKDGMILLTKEYRPELKRDDYRLPGGKVFDTLEEYRLFLATGKDMSEKARDAAIKEAHEEAGIDAQGVELFVISRCGLTIEWDLYYFVVSTYEQSVQDLEPGEVISVVPTKRSEAKEMCLDGRISEERSALVLLRYLNA